MKIVAFNGSARKDGNTTILVREIFQKLAQQGFETELVQLSGKKIKACLACYQCFENKNQHCNIEDDELNACIDKMLAAEGIILASPTYIADVTSVMKALIERAGMVSRANNNMFRRKVTAAVSVASWAGAIHTFDSLNHFFLIGEMIVVGSSNWNLGFGREKGQVLQDLKALETMQTLGRNMAWLLKKVHA
ncbi:MAG: flavodoxin family protein [Desulfobacterales bacterium]|nr:MAG: flavodoxin family protein [Desulfobacterales bacterium]